MEGNITKRAIGLPNRRERPAKSSGETRRDFIKMPLALAAGSVVMPSFLGSLAVDAKADKNRENVTIAPRYYPLNHFNPQIDLTGNAGGDYWSIPWQRSRRRGRAD